MELTVAEVVEILRAVDAVPDDAELVLVLGDTRLTVRKAGFAGASLSAAPEQAGGDAARAADGAVPAAGPAPDGSVPGAGPAPAAGPAPDAVPDRGDAPAAAGLRAEPPEGAVVVRAPMAGTFYRAQSPGARPFVELGQAVSPTDVVGLIEVMKLFYSVPAGDAGQVSAILVEDGRLVELNQPLVVLEPSD